MLIVYTFTLGIVHHLYLSVPYTRVFLSSSAPLPKVSQDLCTQGVGIPKVLRHEPWFWTQWAVKISMWPQQVKSWSIDWLDNDWDTWTCRICSSTVTVWPYFDFWGLVPSVPLPRYALVGLYLYLRYQDPPYTLKYRSPRCYLSPLYLYLRYSRTSIPKVLRCIPCVVWSLAPFS